MSFWSPKHPARLRRSSLTYSRDARSSRLTPRAPRRRKFAHGFLPGSFLLQVTLAAAVLASCATDAPAPPAPPLPEFQPTASVEDIMRAMVDPSADAMWDAVVTTVTEAGVEEVRPRTEEDWWALERGAIMLVEAGNLLLIDGRRIAREGSVSALPGFDLEPEEIAVRVADNRDTWMRLARELHDAGVVMLDAARARDADALLAGGDRLDVACENCHSRFWHPNDATGTTDTPSP